MKYLHIFLIVVFTLFVLLFKFQNLNTVTLSFLGASLTLPASLLVIGVYVLGMFTGGMVLNLLRTIVHGATRRT